MNIASDDDQPRRAALNFVDSVESTDSTTASIQEMNVIRRNTFHLLDDVLTNTLVGNYAPESMVCVLN